MIATLFRHTVSLAVAATATMLIVAGSAAPASAAAIGTAPTMTVNIAGIDLTSPSGMARVEAEVQRAARRVCATGRDRFAAAAIARSACIESALASAMPQLEQLASAQRDARAALADAGTPTGPVSR